MNKAVSFKFSTLIKAALLFFISLAPYFDLLLIDSFGIMNDSSTRIKTIPIFVCIFHLILISIFLFKTKYIVFYNTDIPWILLTIFFLFSISFSITTFEDKLSFVLVLLTTVIASLYLSVDKNDGFNSLILFIAIFCFIAFSMFLIRFISSGDVGIARGGLNVYTMSGIIFWLLLLLNFLYGYMPNSRLKKYIYFINFIITIISIISANRMGLVSSLVIWIFLLSRYNKKIFFIIFLLMVYFVPILFSFISELYIFRRFNVFADYGLIEVFMGSRGDIWNASIEQWTTNYPVFGVGLGAFSYLDINGHYYDSAHNFFLNLFVEHGLLFGPFVILLWFLNFYKIWKTAPFIFLIIIGYSIVSSWTIFQSVGMVSAFNLLILILLSRSKLPYKLRS